MWFRMRMIPLCHNKERRVEKLETKAALGSPVAKNVKTVCRFWNQGLEAETRCMADVHLRVDLASRSASLRREVGHVVLHEERRGLLHDSLWDAQPEDDPVAFKLTRPTEHCMPRRFRRAEHQDVETFGKRPPENAARSSRGAA